MSTRYTGGIITNDPQPLNPAAGNAANGVFTMNQYTQAVQNGTWPAYDPYFDQTTLLLHGNGTNGAQNNTFLDSSTNNFTITRNGNTTQGSFSPFSKPDGRWGISLDGSNDYLSVNVSGISAGTSTFTLGFWVYLRAYPASDAAFVDTRSSNGVSTTAFQFGVYSTGALKFYDGTETNLGGTVPLNTWTHIQLVRDSGNTVTPYINGTATGTTVSCTRNLSDNFFWIGCVPGPASPYLNAYISNLFWLVGSATAPASGGPTAPQSTSTTNQKLLVAYGNRFADFNTATTAKTVTVSGATVTPFSPFPTQSAYSPTVNGGSGYFDGSGDYLSVPASAQFLPGINTDFTFEAWVYLTATPGAQGAQIVGTGEYGLNSDWSISVNSSRLPVFYINVPPSGLAVTSSTAINLFSWNHIAVTRSGTSTNNLKMFLNGVNVGQTSTNITLDYTGNNLTLGADENGDEAVLTGYISGLRLINGTGYTSITTPTAPPTAITNTVLLTNFTNAGIVDSTMSNNLETVGNAQIDTAVKKFGDGSLEFDGTGDYLLMNGGDSFAFGTGNFTVEFWVNITVNGVFYDSRPASTDGVYVTIGASDFPSSSGNSVSLVVSGSRRITGTANIKDGAWHHVAVARSGTTTKLFVDGVQTGSDYTDTNNYLNGASRPVIASQGFTLGSAVPTGYIDDLRITKGIARYTSNFAVPYLPTQPLPLNGGSYAPYTTLMLPGTGTNGAQNNTFLDSSTNNFTITRNGNTTQGTFSPFSREDGYWGNYFDGSGDYLITPSNSAFDPSGQDVTVDCWVYLTRYVSTNNVIFEVGNSSVGDMQCLVHNTGEVRFQLGGATGSVKSGFQLNTWHYITCVKSGTDFTVYLDGVAGNTVVRSPNSKTTMYIGAQSGGNPIDGYISNFRYVRGSAIVPTSVPTAPLTNIANTSLLTCQSNRFVDNSSNNFALTRNGDVKVSTFSPFGYLNQYSPTVNGGSGYFDGSGDELSLTYSTSDFDWFAEDYTIECWIMVTGAGWQSGGIPGVVGNYSTITGTNYWSFGINGSLQPTFYYFNGVGASVTLSSVTGTYNQWMHIAMCKTSSGIQLFGQGVGGTVTAISGTPQSSAGTPLKIGSTAFGYITNVRIVKGTALYSGSTYTIPTAPPTAITNTSLLLNFTNAGIYDASMSNDLETVGNAQISTSVSKFGGGSMAFDGTGDYLVIPNQQAQFSFGTGDFTIEAWIYLNSMPSGNGYPASYWIVGGGPANSNPGFDIAIGSTNLQIGLTTFASLNINVAHGMSVTTWYHIAIVRSGATLYAFKDGVQLTTASVSGVSADPMLTGLAISAAEPAGATSGNMNGYISNLRILKGVALLPTALQTSQWQDQ